jgi:cob(I)alamin adenosyltransferase
MPTLPSGRTLGLASTVNYAQLVWREQNHPINRAALEMIQNPEDLYSALTVVEKTADGRDQVLELSIQDLLDGKGEISPADRVAYAEWLKQPHMQARVREDLDKLHDALANIAFHLPPDVRDLFPEDHAAEALLAVARFGLERAERKGD